MNTLGLAMDPLDPILNEILVESRSEQFIPLAMSTVALQNLGVYQGILSYNVLNLIELYF